MVDTERVDGRSLRYEHRRPELLNQVAEYVLAHGVTGLAMRPLAAAVGVSHGTLLHHFGSKENLLTEVIELLRDQLVEAADVAGSEPTLASLTTWWRATTTDNQLAIYRLLFEVYLQAMREPERYERYIQRVLRDAHLLLEHLVRAVGCPADQAPLVASMIVAQARGLQLDLVVTADHDRVDRSFALFVDLVQTMSRTWRRPGPDRSSGHSEEEPG